MDNVKVSSLVQDATFEFSLGNEEAALQLVNQALELDPESFEAWHAKTEILYAQKDYESAKDAALKARILNPDDIHINTSLSRIWVRLGDKSKAEYFGAQARMLSWGQGLDDSEQEIY